MFKIHPQILPADSKEIHFFDHGYGEGLAWYRSQFPLRLGRGVRGARLPLTGEATPYYLYHPLAPERIATHLPAVRIIALLRDPIRRADSHYRHEVGKGRETLSFPDAVRAEEERLEGEVDRLTNEPGYRSPNHQRYSYKARGVYVDQLDRYRAYFSPEQILLVESERLFVDSKTEIARIFAFLGVDDRSIEFPHEHHSGQGQPIDSATLDYLRDHFKPFNDRLREQYDIGHSWDY